MLLRELSVDVVPILTGAGIAGLAIGFGAQNLVRDVISGFFLILEDQVRIGDLARINGVTGIVEQINLRTIILRDGDGAVQVFPNGTITALANLSKQFAYAVVDVRVAYSENIDRVIGTIREVGASMERDAVVGRAAPRADRDPRRRIAGRRRGHDPRQVQDAAAQPGQGRQRAAAAPAGRIRRPRHQTLRAEISSKTPMVKSRAMRTFAFALCPRASLAARPHRPYPDRRFSVPVVYKKLPNGLRVVISENHAAPVVVVEVMYRIGFRIEPQNRTGFAHLFEHMMFQGSEHVGKFEHVRIVNENGGTLNGSTRFDHTNYFEVMPSNALELAMWLEADRMRSLKITPETLKNQQDVVSEEVRVNVLNQPYGAFEWLGLPQKANTNWYNAHNFYGDLVRSRGGEPRRREEVLRHLLRAEQRRARRVRRHDAGRSDEAGREAFRRHSVAAAAAAARHQGAAADGGEDLHRERQAGAHAGGRVRLSPARADDEGLLRAVAARSAARQRREREALSGADQGEPDRVGRVAAGSTTASATTSTTTARCSTPSASTTVPI